MRTDFGGCREEGGADLHHAWTEAGALCGIPSRRLELCRCLFVAKRSSRTCAECRVKAIEATLGP
ncbi:hypothetical protein ACGFRB_10700 [Streptomyces sp. NPDC048718]|uniref:hypothetical protein n=1 Tax=Streptomyces sp. NPDC048718 TaxID=3365587 RepID=UPI003716E66A